MSNGYMMIQYLVLLKYDRKKYFVVFFISIMQKYKLEKYCDQNKNTLFHLIISLLTNGQMPGIYYSTVINTNLHQPHQLHTLLPHPLPLLLPWEDYSHGY